ncbi:MAG: histidine phosphotransferase family protein [Sulfitobacter sp.]
MTPSSTDLAALIGSRICHDLISPIGAINNGLELLNMSGAAEGPEMSLIGESVGNASARIRFFRIAFGAAGDQMVGRSEIVSILRDLYHNSRLEVVWDPSEPQPRSAVRLSFLALLCLETAMPYGGQIVARTEGGTWRLKGTADKLNVDAPLWEMLANVQPPVQVQPSQVQFALLPMVASDDDRQVTSQADEKSVEISF